MDVQAVMTKRPAVISADTPGSRVWEMLRDLDVRHLPVINQDRELVGIVSDRDLAVVLARDRAARSRPPPFG